MGQLEPTMAAVFSPMPDDTKPCLPPLAQRFEPGRRSIPEPPIELGLFLQLLAPQPRHDDVEALQFREGSLTLDAGEFVLELLPRVGEDGEVVAYQSVTTVLGYEFQFGEDDSGNPVIVLGRPPYEYRFGKVE